MGLERFISRRVKPLSVESSSMAAAGTRKGKASSCAGMTLVEVVISMLLFTMMSLGAIAGMVQVRKMSESNVWQVSAEAVAQGIIERIHVTGYASVATDPALPLEFMGYDTSRNLCTVQTFNLTWAPDATTFTSIGELVDPLDQTAGVRGVLVDAEFRSTGGQLLRPRKYMNMRVNLRRTLHANDDNVEILLTYSWQPPNRRGNTNADFVTREIRTVRSEANSY